MTPKAEKAIRYVIVYDDLGKVVFAGWGSVEFPDDPPPRTKLVNKLREQIAQGNYATMGKLEIAAEKVTEELLRLETKPSADFCPGHDAGVHKPGVDGSCLRCGFGPL